MKSCKYLPLVLLVVLAGCGGGKDKKKTTKKKQEVFTQVDIPTANDAGFLFDEMSNEFVKLGDNIESDANIVNSEDEFKWLENEEVLANEDFKIVHFDFDKSTIRADQEPLVERNIALAKSLLDEDGGDEVTFVVEGHACSSAGTRAYNIALSEERAKVERDRFVAAGIPVENVKIVARGSEIPVKINGVPVTGDRVAQGPNRRDEVRVIYS